MTATHNLTLLSEPGVNDLQPIYDGVREDWEARGICSPEIRNIALVIRDEQEVVQAGFYGQFFWGWLTICALWTQPELRGQGIARDLVYRAEEEARGMGGIGAMVDTFSFQARGFYVKQGYEVVGAYDNFPHGEQRFYLSKQLN